MEIQLSNIGKRFGSKWLFDNLDYEFNTGNIYAITGKNGSGKSTLLKVLAGLLKPSKGELRWKKDGIFQQSEIIYKELTFSAPYARLPEDFTLEEVYKFYTAFKPFRKTMSISTFAHRIQLMNEIYNPLNQYSMGMMQRVKLGLSLFSNSEIVLLDEPTSNLDKQGKAWFFELLHQFKKETIFILASNEEEEINNANYCLSISDFKK